MRVILSVFFVFNMAALGVTTYAQELVVKSVTPLTVVNSSAEELMAIVDKDKNNLYFTRIGHLDNTGGKGSGSDIWALSLTTSDAKPGNKFDYWNNRENNALVGFNADGSTVYLLNGYGKQDGIAFSRNLDGNWTRPEVVPIPGLSAYGFKGFYMSPDFKYLLISMSASDAKGEEDLYVSLKQPDGKWAKPKNLGASINSSGFEISPFLTEDGKTLFFSSNGHEGLGNADIFMAQRLYDSWDVWTKPVNLGQGINSEGFDAYFSFYDSVGYVSSTRQGGLCDIYKITLESTPIGTRTDVTSSGNQILSESEIVSLFGFIFDPLIEFDKGTEALSAKDKELLWFVADKLNKRPDVSIGLYQGSGGNTKQKRRFQMISDYLKELNFPAERVMIEANTVKPSTDKPGNQAVIQLIFFKLK